MSALQPAGSFTIQSLTLDNSAGQFDPAGLQIQATGTARTITFQTSDRDIITAQNNATAIFLRTGTQALTLNFDYSGYATIDVDATSRINMTSVALTGTGGLIKDGDGTLRIDGNDAATKTFSGGVILRAGTLEFGSSVTSGTSPDPVTLTGGPFGTGTLRLEGGTLRNYATTTQGYTLYNNVQLVGNVGFSFAGTGNITVSATTGSATSLLADSALDVSANQLSWGQVIAGAYGLTKTGEGILDLGNLTTGSTYSGGFILDGGTVTTYGSATVSSGTLVSSPFGLGTLTLRSGTLRGQTATSGRTYYNAVAIDGDVTIGGNGDTGLLSFSPGTGQVTTLTGDRTLTINSAQVTWGQNITGAYRLTKDGPGILYLSGANNSFSALTVKAGTVSLDYAGNTWPDAPSSYTADQFVLDGGTLQFRSGGTTTLNNNRGIALGAAGGTLQIDATYIATGASGTVSDLAGFSGGTLTKTGAGDFIIQGTGTYSGPTNVQAGRMFVYGSLDSSRVDVQSGAAFGGTGQVFHDISVHAGGTLAPGSRTAAGTLTTAGALSLESGAHIQFDLNTATSYDALAASKPVSLDGADLVITLGYQPSEGDAFVLIENDSGEAINGLLSYGGVTLHDGDHFNVTSGGFTQEFQIDYDYEADGFGDNLAITALSVPEPSAWGAAGPGDRGSGDVLPPAAPRAGFERDQSVLIQFRESGERILN
ncbi:MAG: autotransporter-associated beta strand repeat-containing protein [Chthoniobacter sp.]